MIYFIILIVLTVLAFRHVAVTFNDLVDNVKKGNGNIDQLDAIDRLRWTKILLGIVITIEVVGAFVL